MSELYLHYANTPSWRGAQLRHRDNFTFLPLPFIHTSINTVQTGVLLHRQSGCNGT